VKSARLLALAIGCSVLGYLSFWLPWRMAQQAGTTGADNPIDGMQSATLLLLMGIGFVSGLIVPERSWLGGVSAMALLPAAAIFEMLRDPTSHNLFPLEFLMYGILTLPGIFGGFVAKEVARLAKRAGQRGKSRE
jgi:hypothetical protein